MPYGRAIFESIASYYWHERYLAVWESDLVRKRTREDVLEQIKDFLQAP